MSPLRWRTTTNIAEDLREIRDGVHSIIGTPGRAYDLLAIAAFDTSLVKTLVVVDVDNIFSNGYKQRVTRIVTLTHCSKLLMCASSDQDMSDAMKLFAKIPIEIIAANNSKLCVSRSEVETLRDESEENKKGTYYNYPSRQRRQGPAPLASFEDLPSDDQHSRNDSVKGFED
ncbi:eukaryotic initiation factor 4A-like protein [Leptotrombidium deliense]|uniref:Eukaryotic initiation factor 4A-like protein n=1 Tax=Leptotrombidium deliense TaxID=299467 RepID=A0A443S3B6_9ACAR|nr:eukaryotic initiation factor 4A-like protein [Leptotrombidium deliense]